MSREINRGVAQGAIGNRTIGVPFEFVAHDREVGHSFVIGPTRDGMTASVTDAFRRVAEASHLTATSLPPDVVRETQTK